MIDGQCPLDLSSSTTSSESDGERDFAGLFVVVGITSLDFFVDDLHVVDGQHDFAGLSSRVLPKNYGTARVNALSLCFIRYHMYIS